MFLLDTNVVSELRKFQTAAPAVVAWAQSTDLDQMHVSVVTLLEIQRGILQVARRDSGQGTMLQEWIQQSLLKQFAGRILDVDTDVVLSCARLHVPDPKPELDALIGATALVHDLTIVTRNTRDFEGMGVRLLDPWIAAS